MKNRIIHYIVISAIIFLFAAFSGCRKDKIEGTGYSSADSANIFLYNVMQYWYLWNREVPEVNPLDYSSPGQLLEVLKYDELDRWSFVGEKRVVQSLFEEGEFNGYGFYLAWDTLNDLRIALVYENTDAYAQGVRRSNKIISLNNTGVDQISDVSSFISNTSSLLLEIIDTAGITREVSIDRDAVSINSVINKSIIDVDGIITGYLVYDSFLEFSEEDVLDAFDFFKSNGVEEFVLDLRYNGGGSNALMETIADILIQPEDVGEIFYTMQHNEDRGPEEDVNILFEINELNLGLERVFVITTASSASASEALINGLEPHMDVIQIGSTTHGKPVGMYRFDFGMWSILPVSIINVNAEGNADFFNGLVPDHQVIDDVTRPFGDPDEMCLAEALHYIQYGDFALPALAIPKSVKPPIMPEGIYSIINSF